MLFVAAALLFYAFAWRTRPHATPHSSTNARAGAAIEASSVNRQPAPDIATSAFSPALRRRGAANLAEAWALVQTLPADAARSEFLRALLHLGIETDPAATLDAAAALTDLPLRDLGVTFALELWSRRDPTAALAWVAAHPPDNHDTRWFDAAVKGFGARPPDDAIAFLQRLEIDASIAPLARSVVFHYNEQGRLADVCVSLEQLPDGPVRETLIKEAAYFWAQRDPDTAASWLEIMASDLGFREGMAAILQTVAPAEPNSAHQQVRDVRRDLVYLWTKRDPGGAAVWLQTETPHPSLDAALALLAENVAPIDPIEARTWLDMISDPQHRDDLARRLEI